jgi:hypothetical protein
LGLTLVIDLSEPRSGDPHILEAKICLTNPKDRHDHIGPSGLNLFLVTGNPDLTVGLFDFGASRLMPDQSQLSSIAANISDASVLLKPNNLRNLG